MTKLALIDIGSNSIRMAVYQLKDNQIKEIYRYREFVQLAKDMTSSGAINEVNFQAGIDVLKHFRSLLQKLNISHVTATATEAIRQASNQAEFLAEAKKDAQIEINVLSGEQEAYYDYLAIKKDTTKQDFLFLDMGGGSFELGVVHKGHLKQAVSRPYGAVKLYDSLANPDCLNEYQQTKLNQMLHPCWREIDGLGIKRLVLIGGVHRLLFEVMQISEGDWHSSKPVLRWIERIQHNNLAANVNLENMEFARAPLMPVGLMPLKELIETFGIEEIKLCPYALREGILEYFLLHDTWTLKKDSNAVR